MSLLEITDRFVNHLDSLERMLKFNDDIIKQQIEEKSNHLDMAELIDVIIELKIVELHGESETDHQKEKYDLMNAVRAQLGRKNLVDFIYNNLDVYEDEEKEIIIETKSLLLKKMLNDALESQKALSTDINQLNNSIVISLVSSLELLIGDLLKEFLLNVDKSDFLTSKTIQFSKLAAIGSIEEARSFLVDQYIEELLRQSFNSWINEIENKGKINLKKKNFFKNSNDIELVNETFQRRHLLIHNDGIVNDLYLLNVDSSCLEDIEKGKTLIVETDYIESRISLFRKLGIILIFLFSEKIHRKDKNEFFIHFNTKLLHLAVKKCEGARNIFKEISNDMNYDHSSRLVSKINYFLSFKLSNEFEVVKEEVEEFDTSTLSIEYRMAKHILLDNIEEAFYYFKEHVHNIDDNEFFHIIEWPLIRLVKNELIFKEFIKDRIDNILETEGGDQNEKLKVSVSQ